MFFSKWYWKTILLLIFIVGLITIIHLNNDDESKISKKNTNISYTEAMIHKEGRIALVIGNSNYEKLSSLKNPHSDAEAIAQRLKKLNFTLIHPIQSSDVQYDLNQEQLIIARNQLLVAAEGKKIVFIYYSGHGASLGQRLEAYILPVDINKITGDKASLELLEKRSFSLHELLEGLDQKAELILAVFDACREIPQLATKGIFENNNWKGLARISGTGAHNRIIAYSGSQGQVVADGEGRYSPYTRELLNVLDNHSNLEIGNLFRKVAMQTKNYTHQTAEVLIQGVDLDTYYLKREVDISILQQKLKERGYYNGEINGIYDSITENALHSFSEENK